MAMAAFTDIIVVVKEEEGPGDFWPDRPTNGDAGTKPKASRTEQIYACRSFILAGWRTEFRTPGRRGGCSTC